MGSRIVSFPEASQTNLLQLSRDALRRAGASSGRGSAPQALVEDLGFLSQTLGCVDGVLAVIRAELWRRERAGDLAVVDGPFVGEPVQALATVDLWMTKAGTSATATQRAVDNAQIAASGLAQPR